jgi:hypothetical protein
MESKREASLKKATNNNRDLHAKPNQNTVEVIPWGREARQSLLTLALFGLAGM